MLSTVMVGGGGGEGEGIPTLWVYLPPDANSTLDTYPEAYLWSGIYLRHIGIPTSQKGPSTRVTNPLEVIWYHRYLLLRKGPGTTDTYPL